MASNKSNEERVAYLEDKAEELSQQEQEELVIDFDEAAKEYREENPDIQVKFNGEIYTVPAKMPFSFSMFFFRNCVHKEHGKQKVEVPEDKIAEFIERMLGKDFLVSLENSDVSIDFAMETVATQIMEKWGYGIRKTGEKMKGQEETKNKKTPAS